MVIVSKWGGKIINKSPLIFCLTFSQTKITSFCYYQLLKFYVKIPFPNDIFVLSKIDILGLNGG